MTTQSGWEITPTNVGVKNYDSLDVLWNVNPEFASVAYAHRDGLISSEIIPLLAHSREMQSNEKIALAGFMVDKCAIDADERVAHHGIDSNETISIRGIDADERVSHHDIDARENVEHHGIAANERVSHHGIEAGERVAHHGIEAHLDETRIIEDTRLALTRAQEEGMTARTGLVCDTKKYVVGTKQANRTERARLQYRSAVDMMRLRCETDVGIVKAIRDGTIQVSEIEARARYMEASERIKATQYIEDLRANLERGLSQDKLHAQVTQIEREYALGLYNARLSAEQGHSKQQQQVIQNYLKTQLAMMRAAVFYEISSLEIAQKHQATEHETTRVLGKSLLETLVKGNHDYIRFIANLPSGNLSLHVRRGKYEKK